MSTASPGAGHATEPKAPARPASGRRIKATGPVGGTSMDSAPPGGPLLPAAHGALVTATLAAFDHLTEAQACLGRMSVAMDDDALAHALAIDLAGRLQLLGASLRETSGRLTGEPLDASLVDHVRALQLLDSLAADPGHREDQAARAVAAAAAAFTDG